MADSIAVCVTGLDRSMMQLFVVSSFRQRVLAPLRTVATVHPYLAIIPSHTYVSTAPKSSTNSSSSSHDLEGVLSIAYEAVSVQTLSREDGTSRVARLPCPISRNTHHMLIQWVAIERCFDTVEAAERAAGRRYTWLYRLRSDMGFHADVPRGPELSSAYVYVPLSGLSNDNRYRCMNSHFFLCPRQLCRPYFRLLELWSSTLCMPAPSNVPLNGSRLPSRGGTGWTALPHGRPDGPYKLPLEPPHRYDAQWYLFARYSKGRPCPPPLNVGECCGQIRPLAVAYTIVRSPIEMMRIRCPDHFHRLQGSSLTCSKDPNWEAST